MEFPAHLILLFAAGYVLTTFAWARYRLYPWGSAARAALYVTLGLAALGLYLGLSAFPPIHAGLEALTGWINTRLDPPNCIKDCAPTIPRSEHLGALLSALLIAGMLEVLTLLLYGWRPRPVQGIWFWLHRAGRRLDAQAQRTQYSAPSARLRMAADAGDSLYQKLGYSAVFRRMVLLTLQSGKVYAGHVLRVPPLSAALTGRGSVRVVPLVSGARGGDGRVQFTTFYDEAQRRMDEMGALDDADSGSWMAAVAVDFPIADIRIAGSFDPDVYLAFNLFDEPLVQVEDTQDGS